MFPDSGPAHGDGAAQGKSLRAGYMVLPFMGMCGPNFGLKKGQTFDHFGLK